MTRTVLRFVLFAIVAASWTGTAATSASAQAPAYHVAKRVKIGGEGGWDYITVDSPGHRLFITHATHVVVYDWVADSIVGDIPNTIGIHGVALAPDLGRGFTSNGRDSSVTIFDLKSLAVLGKLSIPGRNPDAITYDAVSKRIFTFNHGTHDATVIDAAKGTVLGTIPNLGTPETGVTDGKGMLWVNIEDTGEIVEVDTRKMSETRRWSIAPCETPTGLAIDRTNRILFAACGSRHMTVIDAAKGSVITTLPIGMGADAAAFDEKTGLAFASSGDGTITVVKQGSAREYQVVQTIQTQRGARTMAYDAVTRRAFTVSAEYGPAPAPTAEQPRPRAPMIPGSFTLLIIEP